MRVRQRSAKSRLPGVLFIGVNVDGTTAGIDVSDRLLQTLADIKPDGNILPPPTLAVEKRVLKDAPVVVVTIWPADEPPVCYRGRIWIGTGPSRGIATAQDERILNEKRRFRDRSSDTHLAGGYSLHELNQVVLPQQYLPQPVAADVLAANNRTLEDQLSSLGMIAP